MSATADPSVKRLEDVYTDPDNLQKDQDRLTLRNTFTRVKVERVLALRRPRAGDRVIDMGSGIGTISLLLADSGATIVSVDYNLAALKRSRLTFCARRPPAVFRGTCCDGQALALRSESVDAIYAIDFVEHIEDELLLRVVREWRRVLRPGGCCLIYTPNPGHLFERMMARNFILPRNLTHVGLRPMAAYRALLTGEGFSIDKAFFEPTHIPVYRAVERLLMPLPGVGELARRRICMLAVRNPAGA